MDRAAHYFESIGMHVLRLKKEIMGYICDRLQEALWREALHILNKDIGTTGDIDDSIVYSAGMRWAFMGSFLTYHLAGGPGGMRDFIKQFDPTLELDWTDLKFPKWNETLEKRLVEGCEEQAAGRTVAEIEAKRNAVLVDMMKVFQKHQIGAGLVLDRELKSRNANDSQGAEDMPQQRVMITAAADGIGKSIARAFAAEGARVHICDVSEAALAQFRKEFPDIAASKVNVRSEGEIDAWFDDALDDLGGLDVLVNNAGIKGPTAPVEDVELDDWRECLEICLDSYFLCAGARRR